MYQGVNHGHEPYKFPPAHVYRRRKPRLIRFEAELHERPNPEACYAPAASQRQKLARRIRVKARQTITRPLGAA